MQIKENACDIVDMMHVLGKKWTFPIIFVIFKKKEASYNEIERIANHTVGPRAMSKTLKELIYYKILQKKVKQGKTYYALSDNGEKVVHFLKTLRAWCNMNDLQVPNECNLRCIDCAYFKKH